MRSFVPLLALLSFACTGAHEIVREELRAPRNRLPMLDDAWIDVDASEVLVAPLDGPHGSAELRRVVADALAEGQPTRIQRAVPARFRLTAVTMMSAHWRTHVVLELQVGDKLWIQSASYERTDGGGCSQVTPLIASVNPRQTCEIGRALDTALVRLSERQSADQEILP